jgi:NAD(P)-dependent dehydrogenase (short-subunit alcohol dehydrogenase family)
MVGMEMPGLHSLFAGLTLRVTGRPQDGPLRHHHTILTESDERTGRLVLRGTASAGPARPATQATIECFALAPSQGLDPALLADGVTAQDRGAVIVVGASRGFGAALALSLLAHGYEVYAVYRASAQRADELHRVAGAASARLHLIAADAREPGAMAELAATVARGDAPVQGIVLSAAAPPLAMGLTAESATELAEYVAESLRLAAVPLGALLPLLADPDGWVLLCSSAALDAPPRDWPHYVSAKAALEGLAAWVAATRPGVRTVVVRPPKMQTAMTNTPSGRIGAAPADLIAARTAEQLARGGLPAGLTTLRPDAREATAV